MKLSNRQREEIEWLTAHARQLHPALHLQEVNDDHVSEFIDLTVHGKRREGHDGQRSHNPLFVAKRTLDMSVKMWIEDIQAGLITHEELRDGSAYLDRVVDSLMKKLPPGLSEFPSLHVGMAMCALSFGWEFRKGQWVKYDPDSAEADTAGFRKAKC